MVKVSVPGYCGGHSDLVWRSRGLIFALSGQTINLGIFAVPLTFLWIVGLTNAFNLIDGLDGLATGLGLIAALTSATIFFLGGGQSEGLLLLILSGALAGFLFYNFYPASIFLGIQEAKSLDMCLP